MSFCCTGCSSKSNVICCNSQHSAVSQVLLVDIGSVHPRASKTLQHQRLHSYFFIPCKRLPEHTLHTDNWNSKPVGRREAKHPHDAFYSTVYSKKPEPSPASLPKEQKAGRPHLSQTLLSCPHRCMDDLQEELSGPGIEDENSSVDRFCGQIPFKSLRK